MEVEQADDATLDRYGRNKLGLSLLMASRLMEAGVRLVQVNLGKNSSWDTHRRNRCAQSPLPRLRGRGKGEGPSASQGDE
ncbi:MAG: DUF1501 domain-containing protein [Planctomycetaceae bacterium]|nr:DUF1501 domain-containing protein [Planctomycetaceae bacterium]